jgi:hypothetical protein
MEELKLSNRKEFESFEVLLNNFGGQVIEIFAVVVVALFGVEIV